MGINALKSIYQERARQQEVLSAALQTHTVPLPPVLYLINAGSFEDLDAEPLQHLRLTFILQWATVAS
jgi:hypothetical protein